jgi:hypothetical protein
MGVTGGAVVTAITAAAKSYVATANSSTQLSREWMAAQTALEQSYNRMGKVATTVLLPYMQEAAKLSQKAASYVEAHPQIVQYAAIGGGTLAAVGTIATAAAGAKKIITTLFPGKTGVQTPTGTPDAPVVSPAEPIAPAAPAATAAEEAAGAETAAGAEEAAGAAEGLGALATEVPEAAAAAPVAAAAGGLAATGVLAASSIGVLVGGIADQILSSSGFNETPFAKKLGIGFAPLNQVATVADYELNKLFGAPDDVAKARANQTNNTANKVINAPASLVSGIQKALAPSTDNSTIPNYPASAQQLESYMQFLKSMSRAQEDYQHTALISARDFNLSQEYALQDYQKQVARSNQQFQISEAQTDLMYQRQRSIANRDFNIQMQRDDQDYQLSRSRAATDHSFDLYQIALTGDAMSYWLAQRQYNIDQSRADQDHQIQESRAKEDHDRQQSDDEQSYEIDKAYREKMQALQIQYNQQDFDIQQQRAKQQFAIQMSDMDYQYRLQRDRSLQDFKDSILPTIGTEGDQIVALVNKLGAEAVKVYQGYLTQIQNDENNANNSSNSSDNSNPNGPGGIPGYDSGGYKGSTGLALLHAGEWVLTKQSVSTAEQIVGGNLTQSNVLRSMMVGSGTNQVLHYNPTFTNDTSSAVRDATAKQAMEMLIGILPRK